MKIVLTICAVVVTAAIAIAAAVYISGQRADEKRRQARVDACVKDRMHPDPIIMGDDAFVVTLDESDRRRFEKMCEAQVN